MHILAQVRTAAAAALAGLPTTGANVFVQEPYPWQPGQVPGLVLATSGDPIAETLEWPSDLRWDVRLQLTARVRGTGDLAAALDQVTSEVQAALCALATVGGKSVEVVPVSVAPPEFGGDGDQPVALRSITFDVRGLYTTATDPDTLI